MIDGMCTACPEDNIINEECVMCSIEHCVSCESSDACDICIDSAWSTNV